MFVKFVILILINYQYFYVRYKINQRYLNLNQKWLNFPFLMLIQNKHKNKFYLNYHLKLNQFFLKIYQKDKLFEKMYFLCLVIHLLVLMCKLLVIIDFLVLFYVLIFFLWKLKEIFFVFHINLKKLRFRILKIFFYRFHNKNSIRFLN